MADNGNVRLVPDVPYAGTVKMFRLRPPKDADANTRRRWLPHGYLVPDVEGARDILITEASFADRFTFGELRHVLCNPNVDAVHKRVAFVVEEKEYPGRGGEPQTRLVARKVELISKV